MLRRWSKPALGLVYSLGQIDSGEFVTVLVGHAWRSLSLGGIVFYSNTVHSQPMSLAHRGDPPKRGYISAILAGFLEQFLAKICMFRKQHF